MRSATLAVLFFAAGAAAQDVPRGGPQLLNLSCVEALVAIGEPRLAGVFSFVPEKDSAAAFADLLVHDKAALRRFLAKEEKDFKAAQGVSQWDHEVLGTALSILSSPLGESLDKPSAKTVARMLELSRAPALSLGELTSRRKK